MIRRRSAGFFSVILDPLDGLSDVACLDRYQLNGRVRKVFSTLARCIGPEVAVEAASSPVGGESISIDHLGSLPFIFQVRYLTGGNGNAHGSGYTGLSRDQS